MTAARRDTPQKDRPWLIRTYSGHSTAAKSNELYRKNLSRGQTGLSVAFDLPTQTGYDSDHPLAKGEVGKVGVPVSHLGDMRTLFDGIPLDRMNTSMTINAPAAWLLSLYIAAAESAGRRARQAPGHDAERHHQGISFARNLHLPARAVAQAHRRYDRLHLSRGSQVEPDERVQLSPAGGGRDADAGAGLRAGQCHRSPRRGACARPGARGRLSAGRGPHLLLRQCRHPLHHRDLQDAGLRRAVGRHHGQPLRRQRRQAAAVPLRRAGEFVGADRAAAGEQRLSHPPGDARCRHEQECPRPLGAVAGVERGARPAAPVGPAMVAAAAADRCLRDRLAGIRRHL